MPEFYTDEQIFGKQGPPIPSPQMPRPQVPQVAPSGGVMSDAEVFGQSQPGVMSDADVFGAPAEPGIGFTGHAAEFGKGLVSAPPALVGGAIKGAAVGARGFSRDQIKVMNDIDAGLPVREADDPMGYQQMPPELRALARQEVQSSIAVPIQGTPIYKAGGAVQNVLENYTKPAPGVTPGLVRDVGAGIGSTIGGVAMGMIPGVGVPLAGAAFTLAGTGEAVDDAIKAGASQEQIERAGRLGSVAGAMDVVDALLPTLGSAGKVMGLLKRVGTAAVKLAFIEGGQEGLQQFTQNMIAQGVYDPNRDLMKDVPYNALVGALSGGVVGGGIGAFEKPPAAVEQGGLTQEAALSGFAGEQTPPAGPAPPAAQPPPPQQLQLPLGGTAAEPQLPLGAAPTGAPTEPPVPPTVIPPAEPKLNIPSDMKPEIADFLNFGPDTSTKGSPLTAPNGPIDINKLLDERTEQRIKSAPGANTGRLAQAVGSEAVWQSVRNGPDYGEGVCAEQLRRHQGYA